MTQGFSIIEAAASGLVTLRSRPLLWLGVSLLCLAGSLLGLVIEIGPAAPYYVQISDLMAGMGDGTPTAENLRGLIALYSQVGLMTLPLTLIWTALVSAAVYRAMLRPEESRFLFLGLGIEEVRLLAVQLMLGGVLLVASLAVSVILTAVAAVAPGPAAGLVAFLGLMAMMAVVLHLWTRLSLATSATFAEGGLRLARSWRLTDGYFWRILGVYLLVGLGVFAVTILWSSVVSAVTGGVLSDMTTAMTAGKFDSRAFFDAHAAAMLAAYGLNAPMAGLQMIATLAPGAAIYRALAGRP